jgi:hypothetical protein
VCHVIETIDSRTKKFKKMNLFQLGENLEHLIG